LTAVLCFSPCFGQDSAYYFTFKNGMFNLRGKMEKNSFVKKLCKK